MISPRVSPNVTGTYYHGGVIFVRTPSAAHEPRDLVADGGSVRLAADTPVALDPGGPFVPVAAALERDARLRDVLARAIPIPALRDHRRVRLAVAVLAIAPAVFLLAVDLRARATDPSTPVRFLLVDLLLAGYVAFELARPTPRKPSAAALALVSIGLRWSLVVMRLCGKGLPLYVYLAPAGALAAALLVVARVPSPSRVALELLDRLGISPADARDATRVDPPPGPLVGYALAAAVGLPALLHVMRSNAVGLATQALVFVAYAIAVPLVGRRIARPGAPLVGPPPKDAIPPARIVWGVVVGLVLTVAIMTGARSFVDTGTELARCVDRLDAEARRLAAKEALELSTAIVRVRGSALLFALTAIVFPLAEERVYRGLLLDTLVKKYGSTYGLFASAVVFGVAHVPVYQLGLYQTVLLGIAFGAAYLEGGIVASIVVHATWNLLLLL